MEVINTIGRRKSSVARIYMQEGSGVITVNERDAADYFPTTILQYKLNQALKIADLEGKFDIKVNVAGGGITGQVEAIRMGMARALEEYNSELRAPLKKEGLFTRDQREVERKKPGQKKARKRFQFSKR
ncbi:MAG: 30S ribosomal protein S9 [Bacteroidetes bacterium]|nr:30S ribosomal protein S9 [Bacteroidota bacterium]